jgi:hypothetical protein
LCSSQDVEAEGPLNTAKIITNMPIYKPKTVGFCDGQKCDYQYIISMYFKYMEILWMNIPSHITMWITLTGGTHT